MLSERRLSLWAPSGRGVLPPSGSYAPTSQRAWRRGVAIRVKDIAVYGPRGEWKTEKRDVDATCRTRAFEVAHLAMLSEAQIVREWLASTATHV